MKKILLVDDEVMILKSLSRVLDDHDQVLTANTVTEALTIIESEHQSLAAIVTDLSMPLMSGKDFFEKIKSAYPHLTNSIIFMSGGAFTETLQAFIQSNQNSHLTKPFDTSELIQAIEKVSVAYTLNREVHGDTIL
jgi:CheY-like chemotaxis protein